jgi:hypothetical protein
MNPATFGAMISRHLPWTHPSVLTCCSFVLVRCRRQGGRRGGSHSGWPGVGTQGAAALGQEARRTRTQRTPRRGTSPSLAVTPSGHLEELVR